MRHSLGWLVAGLIVLVGAMEAEAHQVNVFARAEGDVVLGEVYYRGRVPVQNATIRVLGSAGESLGETKTDAKGNFSFAPSKAVDHRFEVDAGEGHVAHYVLPAAELPKSLAQQPPAASSNVPTSREEARPTPDVRSLDARLDQIATDLAGLRRELRERDDRTSLRDVLGGIGYIAGIAGVAAYLLAGRRRPAATRPDGDPA